MALPFTLPTSLDPSFTVLRPTEADIDALVYYDAFATDPGNTYWWSPDHEAMFEWLRERIRRKMADRDVRHFHIVNNQKNNEVIAFARWDIPKGYEAHFGEWIGSHDALDVSHVVTEDGTEKPDTATATATATAAPVAEAEAATANTIVGPRGSDQELCREFFALLSLDAVLPVEVRRDTLDRPLSRPPTASVFFSALLSLLHNTIHAVGPGSPDYVVSVYLSLLERRLPLYRQSSPVDIVMSDKMSIDKHEQSQEQSDESVASTPDNGGEPTPAPQDAQPVKRKGGRKPIYATSEERKQRNRQAQAAFRERRTEYIKQLEDTIRVHESNLTNLQAAHRSAAEECLMLRYKNSLLERILLEKGIDVQAELQAKTGSPNLGPTHMPQNMMQPPPIQRAILNRHHNSRRSASSIAPKLEPGITSINITNNNSNNHIKSLLDLDRHRFIPPRRSRAIFNNSAKQEYDAPADMMDEGESEGPPQNPYTSGYSVPPPPSIPMQPPTTGPSGQPPISAGDHGGQTQGQNYPSMTQLLDPALDWDPFGLSASMAFPTQFSFDTSNMR
ncbi:hypothetical protein E0Z10_g5370 [Xylaria hypoxylon]|uniref:BZIP domain-containing protein n=1 Tax=Xylaria hypoxylon TaxID=37992 RepID=A0A4Z0Z1A3_9PEZI|nr:hypothetical protein E0Z10_g5370 [Xylaria hypoxylon]